MPADLDLACLSRRQHEGLELRRTQPVWQQPLPLQAYSYQLKNAISQPFPRDCQTQVAPIVTQQICSFLSRAGNLSCCRPLASSLMKRLHHEAFVYQVLCVSCMNVHTSASCHVMLEALQRPSRTLIVTHQGPRPPVGVDVCLF